GLENMQPGETLAGIEVMEPLPTLVFDEPAYSILFSVNDSSYAGRDAIRVSNGKLFDCLVTESGRNPAFKVLREESCWRLEAKESFTWVEMSLTEKRDVFGYMAIEQVSKASGRVFEAALIRLQHLGTFFVSHGDEKEKGVWSGGYKNYQAIGDIAKSDPYVY
nr:hypothetical protein [Tanacetum cinerariifolium]